MNFWIKTGFLFIALTCRLPAAAQPSETVPVPLPLDVWKAPQGDAVLEEEKDGLRLQAGPQGFVYTAAGHLPENLQEMSQFRFRVYRDPRAEGESTLEVKFYERGGKAHFWRKITLDHSGEKEITVPLAWMRWSGSRTPDWRKVQQLGFYCRDKLDVQIGSFAFTRDENGASPSVEELRKLAFPDPQTESVTVEEEQMRLLTDKRSADSEALDAWLKKHLDVLHRDFPFLEADPLRKPVLVVFARRKDYRDFPPRFAAMHNSGMSRPDSGGYTFMGVATSFWSEKYGAERPVFGHEFIHAWLELAAGFPSGSGDWIQEGIANYVQIEVTPQQNLGQIILNGIADENQHLSLRELCSGKRVPMNRYWQALSFIRFLTEQAPGELPALFAAIQQSGETDLDLHLDILDTDWPSLEKAWKDWCRKTYK